MSTLEESDERTEETGLSGSYDPAEAEPRWQEYWVESETYAYDPPTDPDTVYAIDTPPPTVSGDLHMGHLYGHTLQDFAARFHRMHEETTFFPFGYDDNGIASERLTEKELDIRHQDFSRREFQEKTRTVCERYEADFTEKMQSLAMSIDWDRTYKTIEPRVQRISQLSFIDLYERGREYRKRAPAIWCPECETAISQVEMEDLDRESHFQDIAFDLVGDGEEPGEHLTISTTRPELLPACVAVFVHPDDEENEHLVGETARVPLFGQEVPVEADDRVDMETGTGVVMSCTFGDQTDIEWYQAHDLPLRVAIDESGTMTDLADEYAGMSTEEAREAIVEDLDATGALLDRWPIEQTVNVHERCDTPIEFLVTDQWYVEVLDHKERYIEAGREMDWYPEKMLTRYEHWIEGLEWDWCISRQRDSGIPFPVWYCEDCSEVVLADREDLPVDPLADDPPVETCPKCGHDGFTPEQDVFDTWATSSLTPLINAGWDWDDDAGTFRFENPELYPATMRPQGHDIISFWLFHTVVKCVEHTGETPFEAVMINGHVLDEDRKKMSSSKGNVVLPAEVMEEFPVDAARYWAASASVGDDFPFKKNELRQGERLLRKVWNASKLVDSLVTDPADPPDPAAEDLAPIDRWLLARLDSTVERLTTYFEAYEFAKARDEVRAFFWNTFCDNYLEIAKQRLRDDDNPSTKYTLATAHRTFMQLFAPLLPHVTEEVWQGLYAEDAGVDSLHLTGWPEPRGFEADLEAGSRAMEVISALRKFKSDQQLPLNATLDRVEVYGDVAGFEDAIGEVMHVADLATFAAEDSPEATTEIESIDLDYATLGPKYGGTVSEFDTAIEADEYELDDGRLLVAGEELSGDTFSVERSRTYEGDGEMIEIDSAVVVVQSRD